MLFIQIISSCHVVSWRLAGIIEIKAKAISDISHRHHHLKSLLNGFIAKTSANARMAVLLGHGVSEKYVRRYCCGREIAVRQESVSSENGAFNN